MVINVPIIADVDVLLAGGSLEAVRTAITLAGKKHRVFAAFNRNYCCDDICSTLDFSTALPDSGLFPEYPEFWPRPMEIKRFFEHKLIDAGVEFLYNCFPVRRMEDAAGNLAGMVLACRSGFVAVKCRVVLDGSIRRWASVIGGAPARNFVPGDYRISRITVGAEPPADSGLKVTPVKGVFKFQDKVFPLYLCESSMWFAKGDWNEMCKAENIMRQKCWAPQQDLAPDSCIFDLPPALAPDFVPDQKYPFAHDIKSAVELLKVCDPGAAEHIRDSRLLEDCTAVRFENALRYRQKSKLPFHLNSFPAAGRYDVIVAGGGTAGATAAMGAARSSASVLCMELSSHLGGLTTQGRIASYWYGNRTGFCNTLDQEVAAMGPNEKYPWQGTKWEIEWKQHYFLRSACRGGVHVLFNTLAVGALRRSDLVCGVLAVSPDGCRAIESTAVIDSSGNADVAIAAGAEYEFAAPGEAALQGSGVSRANPGRSYANCDFCFASDSDTLDLTSAWVHGREKYKNEFDICNVIGSRERRRIVGDLQLKPEDFLMGRCYSDTIVNARSNFDTHGFIVHGLFMLRNTNEEALTAKVPFRALLPAGLDGILVTGLGISAHRDAMPVVRMQVDVHNQGFAAGLAAGMSAARNRTVRNTDIRELQRMLASLGNLPPEILQEHDGFDPEQAVPEFADFVAVFQNPEENMPKLCRKLKKSGKPEIAALLAFNGNDSGRSVLVKAIADAEWDNGWEYRGMGQFGASASPLDALIIALSKIADASSGRAVYELLNKLTPEHAFSHFRAVSLLLIASPDHRAVKFLEKLLDLPELDGKVEMDFKSIIADTTEDDCENIQRTTQLKEIYLLKALQACDSSNPRLERLERYKDSPIWLYANFCRGE